MARAYLYEHENPHAPERDNGRRFWGYPTRFGGLDAIQIAVLHTAENIPDVKGEDSSAENIAAYGARMDRPASWHRCCDADSTIICLPDKAVAFHVVGYNTISLGLEICTQARRWGQDPDHDSRLLHRAAWVFARWSWRHHLPLDEILTKREVDAGKRGITTHALLDPARRSDPGADFPFERFLNMAIDRRAIVRKREGSKWGRTV
jgi:hypothetical protein